MNSRGYATRNLVPSPLEPSHEDFDPAELVDALADGFGTPIACPDRMHCDLPGNEGSKLLIMPAWQDREVIGVKVVTVLPENARSGRPTIDGVYIVMDGKTGRVSALLEAPALTALRTAATSALASRYLSRTNATTLVIVGTGALAQHLARTHAAVRRLEEIVIWGRKPAKAQAVAKTLGDLDCEVTVVESLAEAVSRADIISCATSSSEPLILSEWVRAGTHLDFVGSFTPQMLEADPALFRDARLVIDTPTALKESGDLIEPAKCGWIREPVTELADLVRGSKPGRCSIQEITVFKSVGTGLADLTAARYFLRKLGIRTCC